MGGKNVQGAFSGVGKLCQQCIKECKQFKPVVVIRCQFVSNQRRGGTLPLAECTTSRGKEGVLQPKIEKAYIGMGEIQKDTLALALEAATGPADGCII